MSELVLFKEGLRVGRRELTLLQNAGVNNLSSLVKALTNAPAVLTTRAANGTLGPELQVAVSGTNVQVAAGSVLLANGTVIALAAVQTLAVTDGTAGAPVVLTAGTTPFLPGLLSLAADRITLTGDANTPDLTTKYSPNDYVRFDNAGVDLGAFRVQSSTATTLVLAEAVPGTGVTAGLKHAPAGKFFPNYPLPGTTRDLESFDTPTLRIAAPGYVALSTEVILALVSRAGAVVTVTDQRQAIVAKNSITQITDANVAPAAGIATSKLDAAAQAAVTKAHQQNTDAYTSSPTFFIGGATGKRVLTTDDLPHTTTGGTDGPTAVWPIPLPEVNSTFSFIDASAASAPKTGARTVQLKLSWGIDGNASAPTVGSTTQTTTISSPDTIGNVSVGQLVGLVLYDGVGRPWAITANTASVGDHSFTVTTAKTDTQGTAGTIAAGAVTIISSAANYRFEVVHKVAGVPDETSKYVETGSLNQLNYPNNARQISFLATPGESYAVRIIGVRNGVEATLTLNTTWGVQPTTPVVNVPSASISASSTLSTATFSWPSPTGFNSSTMDYLVAVQLDGAPAVPVFNQRALETPGSGGAADGSITVPAGPGQLVTIFVRVTDLSGAVISNTDGSRSFPTQTNIFTAFQKETFTLSATGANYAGTPIINLNLFPRTILGGAYEIGGIEVDLTTFNVAAGTRFKIGVAPADSSALVVWSDEFGDGSAANPITPNATNYAPILTETSSARFQSGLLLQLECTNPTVNYVAALTSIVGTITVFYRMVGTIGRGVYGGTLATQ